MMLLPLISMILSNSVSAVTLPCKKLDFDSYFLAQKGKANLVQSNPKLDEPNFNERYLLLKNELVMETLFLIADCETGKFFHEKLEGNLKFSLHSNEVRLEKKGEEITNLVWNGSHWIKAEKEPKEPASSKLPGSETSTKADLPKAYESLFKNYPASNPINLCHPIDFNSSFRAQNVKNSLIKSNPDLSRPNFAGAYLLLRNEFLLDTNYLLVDCKTGKFVDEPLNHEVRFQLGSNLAIVEESGNFPQLYLWKETQWVQIADPVQNKNALISNSISGEMAKSLFKSLPNLDKNDTIRFESLSPSPMNEIVFKFLETKLIKTGKCNYRDQKANCKVEY